MAILFHTCFGNFRTWEEFFFVVCVLVPKLKTSRAVGRSVRGRRSKELEIGATCTNSAWLFCQVCENERWWGLLIWFLGAPTNRTPVFLPPVNGMLRAAVCKASPLYRHRTDSKSKSKHCHQLKVARMPNPAPSSLTPPFFSTLTKLLLQFFFFLTFTIPIGSHTFVLFSASPAAWIRVTWPLWDDQAQGAAWRCVPTAVGLEGGGKGVGTPSIGQWYPASAPWL